MSQPGNFLTLFVYFNILSLNTLKYSHFGLKKTNIAVKCDKKQKNVDFLTFFEKNGQKNQHL